MKKCCLFISFLAQPVFAGGFYLSADYGDGTYEIDFPSGFENEIFAEGLHKEHVDLWTLGGGYKFNDNVAIEMSYSKWGAIEAGYIIMYDSIHNEIEAETQQVSLIASLPYNDKFGIYGRIGVAKVKFTQEVAFLSPSSDPVREKESVSGNEYVAGIGADYKIGYGTSVRLEYCKFGEVENKSLSSFSLGLTYTF